MGDLTRYNHILKEKLREEKEVATKFRKRKFGRQANKFTSLSLVRWT